MEKSIEEFKRKLSEEWGDIRQREYIRVRRVKHMPYEGIAMQTPDPFCSFLREKGLYMEYVTREPEKNKPTEPFIINNARGCEVVEYKDKTYIIYPQTRPAKCTVIYEVLPLIHNDGVFKWKNIAKTGEDKCTVKRGSFDFVCVALASGDGYIDVKYNKCENLHRNKTTLSTIQLTNVSNSVFKDAINDWVATLKRELSEFKPLRNYR